MTVEAKEANDANYLQATGGVQTEDQKLASLYATAVLSELDSIVRTFVRTRDP